MQVSNLLDDRPIALVKEFHEAATIPDRESPPASLDPTERRKLESLLDQELAELRSSLTRETGPGVPGVIGVADALGDITYVAIGAALQLGIDILAAAELFAEKRGIAVAAGVDEIVPLDDLADCYWTSKALTKRPSMSIAIRAYRRGTDARLAVDIDTLLSELEQSGASFKSGLRLFDIPTLSAALGGAIVLCYLLAFRLGLHLGTVFEEIHRSNMTKVAFEGQVRRRDDGKILKGESFEPPHLKDLS